MDEIEKTPGTCFITLRPQTSRGKTRHLPPSLNVTLHWALRADWNKVWIKAAFDAAKEAKIEYHNKVRVTFKDYCVMPTDLDNLASCVKPIMDGLVLAGMCKDDSPACVTALVLESVRVPIKTAECIVVIVEGR